MSDAAAVTEPKATNPEAVRIFICAKNDVYGVYV